MYISSYSSLCLNGCCELCNKFRIYGHLMQETCTQFVVVFKNSSFEGCVLMLLHRNMHLKINLTICTRLRSHNA
jgi:hypothetical protein